MPVNEFEKQVQQKMEELQLRPSGEVWEEVEKHIRKEKKRRRVVIFWWLLPVLLVGSTATWYVLRDSSSQQHSYTAQPATPVTTTSTTTNTSVTEEKSTPVADKESVSGKENTATHLTSVTPTDADAPGKTIAVENEKTRPSVLQKGVVSQVPQTRVTKPGKTRTNANRYINSVGQPKKQPNVSVIASTSEIATIAPVVPKQQEIGTSVESTVSLPSTTDHAIAPLLADTNATNVVIETKEKTTDSIALPVNTGRQKTKKQGWKWGLAVKGGISNTYPGSIYNENSDRLAYSNVVSGPIMSAGAVPPPPVAANILQPSSAGKAFSAELLAEKELSRKWTFLGGVQYSYLSSIIHVGSKISSARVVQNMISDKSIENYYEPATGTNGDMKYLNEYHSVGVTGGLGWKLLARKKFSLSWDNAVSINRLLYTNALHYDAILRGYYKDFKPFTKTQLFVSSGFSMPVLQTSKVQLSFAPFVSYGLTRVLKQKTDKDAHFLSYGAGLRLLFK